VVAAGEKLTYCASNAYNTKDECEDPTAATIETMPEARHNGCNGHGDIKRELDGRNNIATVQHIVCYPGKFDQRDVQME
jgi:hypothetical protein